ncbi:MAG: hypothetical protein ACKOGP_01615, partial [Bacteroidota bacterium]
MYVNGLFQGNFGLASTPSSTGSQANMTVIGAQVGVTPTIWNFFKGKLDDIGIWSSALTQQEITNLYQSSATVYITGSFSVCQGAAASLTATSGFSSYLWNTGATTQTINPTTAGTYTVTATNSSGVTSSASQAVTVNPSPTPAISGTFSACQGFTASLTATAGFNSYLWNNGATTQSINPGTAATYTVTVTNANNCTGSASQAVTINANPAPTITGSFVLCNGTSTLTATAGFASYLWNTGATTQTINPTTAGTYTVTVTNANNCTGSASQAVSNGTAVNITGNFIVCQVTAAALTATGGFASYLWNTGATTHTINPNTAGTYTVTATAAGGCTSSKSQAVTVNPSP